MAKNEPNLMKAKRELLGLKQRDLAALVGRSRTWLSAVERGVLLPQPEEQRKLERILDGPDGDFLCQGLSPRQEDAGGTSLEVFFQQASKDLTRFIREAELAGDLDAAKRLLWVKRFFNLQIYKSRVQQ